MRIPGVPVGLSPDDRAFVENEIRKGIQYNRTILSRESAEQPRICRARTIAYLGNRYLELHGERLLSDAPENIDREMTKVYDSLKSLSPETADKIASRMTVKISGDIIEIKPEFLGAKNPVPFLYQGRKYLFSKSQVGAFELHEIDE